MKSQEPRRDHSWFLWLSTLFAKCVQTNNQRMELKDLIIEHDALRKRAACKRRRVRPWRHADLRFVSTIQQWHLSAVSSSACLPAGLPATPLRSFQASPINLIGRLHAAAYVPATGSSRRHTLISPMPEHLALLPNVPDSIAIDLVWLRCKWVYK